MTKMSVDKFFFEGGLKTALILLTVSALGCSEDEAGQYIQETETAPQPVETFTLAVKFDEGVSDSGIAGILEDAGAVGYERIFPDAPDYRNSFREIGLDRWYRAEFMDGATLTRACDDIASIPGALIVEI